MIQDTPARSDSQAYDTTIVHTQPEAAIEAEIDDGPQQFRGRFRKGYDPRRHVFTQAERSAGFWSAIATLGVGIGAKLHRAGRFPNFKGRRAAR